MLKFKEYFLQETKKVSGYFYTPDKDREEYYKIYKNSYVWIKMSPDQFLSLAYPLNYNRYDDDSFKHNRKRILSNNHEGIIWLQIDKNLGVVSHEGRHRSVVLKRLGVKEIPVKIIWFEKDFGIENILSRKKDLFLGNFIPEKTNEKYRTIVNAKNKSLDKRNIDLLFNEIYDFVEKYPWLEYQGEGLAYLLFPKNKPEYDDYLMKIGVENGGFYLDNGIKIFYFKTLNEIMDKLTQWESSPKNKEFK